ncbi:hypothetical protein SAMN05877753_104361 [Bacillus oleivorans]|uniref:Uncharacterized protein n=1 Tax=Bacillus oleivorans TaxID=1448271 RepID=A0A285CTE7_9BACI|nr:hypothetical protein SAMN05877753_104361 [Bacillus oleivorans]
MCSSLDTGLIWTGEGENNTNLSEYQGSYRQEKEEKARTCQNTKLIRTGEGGKNTNLSEYKAHSDRRGWRKTEPVRI